jgi:hypothetical protein
VRELAQERIGVTLDRERGQAHVARMDGRLRRVLADQPLDRRQQRRPVAPGQVDAADRSLKQDVAGEQRLVLGQRIADVPRAVAGNEVDLELQVRQLQRLAALDRMVGLVALERTETGIRHVGHDVGQHLGLELRAVHRSARRPGDRRDRADVIEVAMGQQDRLNRVDLECAQRLQNPLGLVTRVHDHGGRRVRPTDHVAVLLHRPDREHPRVDHVVGGPCLRIRRRHRNVSR